MCAGGLALLVFSHRRGTQPVTLTFLVHGSTAHVRH